MQAKASQASHISRPVGRIVTLCRGMHRVAAPLTQAFKSNKITAEKFFSLKTETDDYKKSYTKPRQAIATAKAEKKQLPVVLRDPSNLLRTQLDPIMVQFKATEPEFYRK